MIARLLKEAWAPVAVVMLAFVLTRYEVRDSYWLLHVCGGAAVAFFFLRGIDIVAPVLGATRPAARYVGAFVLACSAALAWELGEFALDQLAGTWLQEGQIDTLTDLAFGVCGAALYLAAAAFTERSAERGAR